MKPKHIENKKLNNGVNNMILKQVNGESDGIVYTIKIWFQLAKHIENTYPIWLATLWAINHAGL